MTVVDMAVRQTSLASYIALRFEGELGKRQRQVLAWLSAHPRTHNRKIAEGVNLPVNCVTGRIMELRKMGFVREDGIIFDPITERRAIAWKVL